MTDETTENSDPFGLKSATVEAAAEEPAETTEEPQTPEETVEGGEPVDGDTDGADDKKDTAPLAFDGKPLPKSRRAHEINAIANERLRAKDSEIERLRKELEETKGAVTDIFKKPEEKAPVQTDDEYLISKGYDPDEFLDDGAKKATVKLERKADELDAEIKAVKEQGKKREESDDATASEQKVLGTLNSEITGLPEAEQAIAWDAVNHLQRVEAQKLLVNWEADNPADYNKAIKEYGLEAAEVAAMKEAETIIKNNLKTIVKKGGSPLKWAAQSAKIAGFDFSAVGKKGKRPNEIDGKALEKSQARSGRAAIDTLPAGGVPVVKESDKLKAEGWR